MKRKTEILILLLLSILLVFFIFQFNRESEGRAIEVLAFENPEPTFAYGIEVDSLVVFTDHVQKNQNLSEILQGFKVDYQTIDLLVRRTKNVFDVRRIKAGNRYSVLCANDSMQKVQYFVYEISSTDYVVYDLRDSVHGHTGTKEVEIRERTISGTISSSLWNAMVAGKTDPNLANDLSEIFAWTIDFFGIQKGDSYKVIYDEIFVEDEYVGIGKVRAAVFNHYGRDYYAFYFMQDSVGDYFDDEANSLRRTFLKAPLKFRRISSGFSHSRLHPITKVRQPHHGVDYAAAHGTPVMSVGDGTVTFAAYKGHAGNMVTVKHNSTYTTSYLHLSGFGKGIKQGTRVKQGQVIGYVGSTGRSTGPHLDFRFYRNGHAIDPLKVESPPAEPVKEEYLGQFFEAITGLKGKLDEIMPDTGNLFVLGKK
ncbi:MAG: peptidoglycan DD-metalloendopeptidase family protein [Bacteroidales bacterium]